MRSFFILSAAGILVAGGFLEGCVDDLACQQTATCPPVSFDASDVRSDSEPKDARYADQATSDVGTLDAGFDARSDARVDAAIEASSDARSDAISDIKIDGGQDIAIDVATGADAPLRSDVADATADQWKDASLDGSADVQLDVTADKDADAAQTPDSVIDVDSGPACTTTSCGNDQVCCDNACVAIDATHCYACNAQCAGATPICSAALKGCACTEDSCASDHRDCDAPTGQCVACKHQPDATHFYVDHAFVGSPTGSKGCPYGTITAAIAAANLSTAAQKTIHVAAGTYDAGAGEVFPLQLRTGISLVGAGAGNTIVRGMGAFDHSQLGGVQNQSYPVTVVIGDPIAFNAISDLTLESGATSPVKESFGLFCDRGNTPSGISNPVPSQFPPANVTAMRITVGPGGYSSGIAVTNTKTDGCNFKITGSTLLQQGIWAVGCSINGTDRTVALQVGDGTDEGSNQFSAGVDGAGIFVFDCTSPVRVLRNKFRESAVGIYLATSDRPAIDITDNTFTNLSRWGIHIERAMVLDTLIGNVFNDIGAEGAISAIETTQIKKARRNQIVGNVFGLYIDGNLDTRILDFGTTSDPGLNSFSCNSNGDPNFPTSQMFDVGVGSTGSGTISMYGNAWDHVPPTRSNSTSGAANGTDLAMAPSGQPVVDTSGATQAPACVYPRIPGP